MPYDSNDMENIIPATKISIGPVTDDHSQEFNHSSVIVQYDTGDESDDLVNDAEEIYLEEIFMETDADQNMVVHPNETSEDSQLYHCSTCDVNFHSVTTHINDYHRDQEVVVEMDEIDESDASDEGLSSDPIKIETVDEDEDGYSIDASGFIKRPIKAEKGAHPSQLESTVNTPSDTIGSDVATCKVCSVGYASLKALSAHMRIHKATNTAPQSQISETFLIQAARKKVTLKSSFPKRLENKNVQSVCETCNTIFKSQKSLKLHVRMHNPIRQKTLEEAAEHELKSCNKAEDMPDKKLFYCEICEKSYDVIFRDIHMQTHDGGNDEFLCKMCNKKFSQEAHLIMHLKAHSDPRIIQTKAEKRNIKLPYACQYCAKEFSRPHEKVKHERIHTGEKPHVCEICGKKFRVSYCLTLHMRTHTDARPYVCPHCNKRYKAHSVYNHHLMTHSDVRGYQCSFCPKAFKTAVQLSGHKNSHTKPFSCTECNRPFATLYAVKAHMESHKRPNHNLKHACHICGATYARGFALKDHIKELHSNMVDEPDLEILEPDNITISMISKEENNIGDVEESATQSILPDPDDEGDEVNVPISDIDHFVNEEVVTDWLK